MTLSPSPSTENQCSTVVTGAASLSKTDDISSEHVDDENENDNEEDEEGDMDFNPFLKEAPSLEASSSLSSEIEEFETDVVDSRENRSPLVNVANAPDELQDDGIRNVEPNIATNTVTDDVTVEQMVNGDSDDEDAIWRRTRARYSLVGSTLDELETFLQETDDEDDLHHNIDDEEEYRKFLAAVLNNGDASSGAAQENDNLDEDEDNDADFELELEEALESDVDENSHNVAQEREHERVHRRPETRQKKRQKTDVRQHEFSGHMNRPLRPILPYAPISPNAYNTCMIQSTSSACNYPVCAFTPHQIGQLHCLIYEHVQLLVQLFSLSILDPSRQHVATQAHKLLSEMLHKRGHILASQRVPYPGFCFSLPYIYSAVTSENTSISTDGSFWVPFVSDTVLSVIDVAPLNLVQSYLDDISIAVQEHRQRQLEATYDAMVERECLFPFNGVHSSAGVYSDPTTVSDNASDPKSKKTIAAALVERSKNQSIALVPKDVAKLALRFFPLFNPALFPHKPPPSSVANRVLFTDAEDGLLARGLMRYNTDWKEIQKNFLPCKTPHQIFVRQKNRACSRAPENPIKAVRRLKTSPLTPQEKALIEEGLKIYKLDWMAVWKYMVPHRDPSMLPRQWRTAVGNQKSYKGDEHTKAKRRLYESQRRKSKLEGSRLQANGVGQHSQGWSNDDEANPFHGGGENNSGDDGGNNEDEAYVHEAFLADWRPVSSGISNTGENQNPQGELFTQNRSTNDTRLVNLNNSSSYAAPATFLRPEVNIPYRARRSSCSRVVKLAPDLPPVNLPPTVRIMSQSAFSKFQDEASSKVRQNGVLSQRRGQQDERSGTSDNNAVEKGDSDLQLHPLLFQGHDDASLPYYPLNGNAGSSSSFDFFPNNSPQLNVNLFRYSNQAKHTLNFFNNSLKSNELSSPLTGVDFHPLLQRNDDGNGQLSDPPLDLSTPNPTAINVVPRSPNELDLDIRLSSIGRKENGTSGRESGTAEPQPSGSHDLAKENGNDPDFGPGSVGGGHDEIVMEQEELSDSEDDDVEESVEFECEEMTDSEGEGGSDSDRVENVQNEDVQDDSLPNGMVHGDDSDQDEPRCQETAGSDEPTSLLGLRLNAKLPVTRSSHGSRSSSKKTALPHQQSDAAATQAKKPRKRAQKLDLR
ncbi:putative transcription factor MYB-HB-like family [Helianthus debilis subsp. tardiflorus]